MIVRLLAAIAICCTIAASAHGAEFFVAPDGSDAAAGSSARPFKTIQHAIDAALKPGDKVTILPGTYHEELVLKWQGPAASPMILAAAQKGTVVIDGAEQVKGWRLLDQANNVWAVDADPKAPYNNDHDRWDMPPRSEQVFVDSKPCAHVKDDTPCNQMPDNSFAVAPADAPRYLLKLPRGTTPDTVLTEITFKSTLLDVNRAATHVIIDGVCFRRACDTYQMAMVILLGDSQEVRNCTFEYSSAGSGLKINSSHSHYHDCIFRSNGQFGFALGGQDNIIDNNLITNNDLAGYKEWGTGGTKIVGCGNIIRRNRFIDNLGGVAIWLDCGPCNNVIDSNFVSGNYGEGIRAEICFHNYIGYNIVENTKPCTSTMFGKTRTHCIGISVQNSAQTLVVNNFLKDNLGLGIQLATYNRKGDDLPQWQGKYDQNQKAWLQKSWDAKVIYANDNYIYNNVIVQSTPESSDVCLSVMGLFNGQSPQCFGDAIDYNFYWNSVTHAPKVKMANQTEVPDTRSQWRTHWGLDTHSLGGFSPQDYRQSMFAADSPYAPTAAFVALAKGHSIDAFAGHEDLDYLGKPADSTRAPTMGHIQCAGN